MIILVLLALCGIVAKLWSDVGNLRGRVAALEMGARPAAPDFDLLPRIESDLDVPATTRATARVVIGGTVSVAAVPAQDPRYPGLEPGSRFPPGEEGSGNPGRAQGDEVLDSPPSSPSNVRPVGQEPIEQVLPATTPRFSFEDLFGRKLPIWAGGVTLAVCGFLIVKYSIDAGLLSPWVRVVGGLLFGLGLIAGAEAALRNEDRVRDPRVRQALAGAGVATLYASVLVAANLYDLVPPLVAFAGLALVTVLAALLSIRFGPPSAVLGLVGGLAAPALVSAGQPHVPLLAGYLALAVGGLATLGQAQRWGWLAAAALTGGFGWGAALLVVDALDGAGSPADALAIGGLLLLLGVGLPVLLFSGARGWLARLLGTLTAAAQLAALVATGGFAMLHWGLFGLLALASVWLSRRERALADLPIPALAVALLLMAAWPTPAARDLAMVVGGALLIFSLPAAVRLWRSDGRLSDAAAIAALAATPLASAMLHLGWDKPMLTALALAGAALAAGVAAFGWPVPARRDNARFALLSAATGALLAAAAAIALPAAALAPAWALIAAGLVLLAARARDGRVEGVAWAFAAATLALLGTDAKALSLAAGLGHGGGWAENVRWAVPAGVALLFARAARAPRADPIGQVAAVLLGYVAIAQLVPPALLPLVPALALAAFAWARRATAALLTAAALAVAWAVLPLVTWLAGSVGATVGIPLLVGVLPSPADAATRLLAPALAAALALWRQPPADRRFRVAALAGVGLLGGAAAHVGYKQLFALATQADFVRLGLAERTLWEALLALAALALAKRAPQAAGALGLAAFAHLAWFTLVLHDPLWSIQAVGPLPIANLLLPAYALGFALLWAAGRTDLPPPAERARGWAQMALVLLCAASELRQLTHGSLLSHGRVGEGEDIARSVLAIGIAIGFLLWGIRTRKRDWRIASLIVMLGAVLKVFLLDTSGLHGLMRIGSFAALGFSLIGLGWLYSRTLPDDPDPKQSAPAPTQA